MGTFVFEGVFRETSATGTSSFSPHHDLAAAMEGRGFVSASYVRDMGALCHRWGALDALVTLRAHGVRPDYVHALPSLGYTDLTAASLPWRTDAVA